MPMRRQQCHWPICALNVPALPLHPQYHRRLNAAANDSGCGRVDCPVSASLYCLRPNGQRGLTEVEWSL